MGIVGPPGPIGPRGLRGKPADPGRASAELDGAYVIAGVLGCPPGTFPALAGEVVTQVDVVEGYGVAPDELSVDSERLCEIVGN